MTTIFPMVPAINITAANSTDSVVKSQGAINKAATNEFNTALARAVTNPLRPAAPAVSQTVPNEQRIHIGSLDGQHRSVSELLRHHPDHGKDMWRIIHDPVNRTKPYRQIPKGADVYLNPQTRELSWPGAPELKPPGQSLPNGERQSVRLPQSTQTQHLSVETKPHSDRLELLGHLSKTDPTVSHLLVKHHQGRTQAWNIIHHPQNQNKAYHRLALGTPIYLDPGTGEISWPSAAAESTGSKVCPPLLTATSTHPPTVPTEAALPQATPQMAQAVRAYLGNSYEAMDCYELIIKGLEKMGVRYLGKGGLKANLVNKALHSGLPANAYLTGEGVIEATGSRIYAQTIQRPVNSTHQTQKLIDDLTPLLSEGDILSFSTPSRGHVGVINRRDATWTFVNSGYLDNGVRNQRLRKGVGEELLNAEIRNWLSLASRRQEPLQISLGRLAPQKIRTFQHG